MFILILFGLYQFYYGQRIVTELDGVSDVRYACVISDFYDTFDSLPHEEFLCALHSIPTPTTNLLDRATGGDTINYGMLAAASDLAKFVSFALYNFVFMGVFFVFKKLTNNFR
jgi:hypothetical protein